MKNFTFKLLQQLNKKKADKGFTLIELLVVIIIIGILSAIALPSFLNQANKARQSEAKQSLGAVNRGQQSYFLERQFFSDNINGLGLGVSINTENYSYGSSNTDNSGNTAGIVDGAADVNRNGFDGFSQYAYTFAVSNNQDAVRDYLAIAYSIAADGTQEATTASILCEENELSGTTAFDIDTASFPITRTVADAGVDCADVSDNGQNVAQ